MFHYLFFSNAKTKKFVLFKYLLQKTFFGIVWDYVPTLSSRSLFLKSGAINFIILSASWKPFEYITQTSHEPPQRQENSKYKHRKQFSLKRHRWQVIWASFIVTSEIFEMNSWFEEFGSIFCTMKQFFFGN